MLTSFFAALAERPDLQARLCAEARDAGAPGELLDATLLEVERLHPPLPFSLRGVVRPFTFGGYDIRPGDLCAYSSYYTGRLAALFPEPLSFQPERFLGGRRPPPYALVGFGGGWRACIGKRFAGLEMRLIIGHILRHFDLTILPDQPQEVFFNPALQRTHGLQVHVQRRRI
jgi:hypothetical protein